MRSWLRAVVSWWTNPFDPPFLRDPGFWWWSFTRRFRRPWGLACPNCSSVDTGGSYDQELLTEEEQEFCELWVCNECGWQWNRWA